MPRVTLLTIGTFDAPHIGHASFLRRCEAFAERDRIMVGINSDDFVLRYKGVAPLFSERERQRLVASLGYQTRLNDGPGRDLIEFVMPEIVAIGSDWAKRDYHAQIATPVEFFEEHGIAMLYIPYTEGISSTLLKERLGHAEAAS
jgi:glycerol-3-phosphate cytidylyltransferase